jgi:signal transduction histidine kinase/DNA-binding response OmpR family regulator
MDEVSVKSATKPLTDFFDKEGPPFSTLLDGVPYTEEYLRGGKGRISWDGFCKLLSNVGKVLNDETLEEMGQNFVHSKLMRKYKTAYQLFISPQDFYRWLYSNKSPGRQDFTCIYPTVADLGKNRILCIMHMEEGYTPCREFFIITKGALIELSTIIGFPSSKVELNIVGNSAYYNIEVSEGVKFISFLRYMIRWPINLLLAKRELREALESLTEAYIEIVQAKNTLEKRVEERTTELKQAQEMRDRIFANISHEFRTPLTLIKGPVELLLEQEQSANIRQQYGMILHNTNRLLVLVNQLLDLSKIESGKMKPKYKYINLTELIRILAASFESLALQNSISFSVSLPNVQINGWFDSDCLEKIISNLLSNALKFTSTGGNVRLLVKQLKDDIEINVTDSGTGIPSEHIEKIFERFYQVDSSNIKSYSGTGIGLAHTKDLVELLGGKIRVNSELGKGSSFVITFPYVLFPREADDKLQSEKLIQNHFNINTALKIESNNEEVSINHSANELPVILIIEDNAGMRKFIKSVLEGNYLVEESVHGLNGLDKAYKIIPDLIICDVMMPNMSGFEVCNKLKLDERTSHIPIILLTAKASIESKIEGLEAGADSYLIKPFNKKELLICAKNLIEQRKILREKFSHSYFTDTKTNSLPSVEKIFLDKVTKAIDANLCDEEFNVEKLAREVALSRSQLNRKLMGLINRSPGEFILGIRLGRAEEMLKRNVGSIAEIAYSTGFNTPNYFSKCFRKMYGCSPSEYKERVQA